MGLSAYLNATENPVAAMVCTTCFVSMTPGAGAIRLPNRHYPDRGLASRYHTLQKPLAGADTAPMGQVDNRLLRRWQVSQAQQATAREPGYDVVTELAREHIRLAPERLAEADGRSDAEVFYDEDR
jgi:hypothetical protein